MSISPEEKLAAARYLVSHKVPYFTHAVFHLVPKKVEGLNTFGVSKNGVLYWDPAAAERWTVDEIAAVLVHEINHYLRMHNTRGILDGPTGKIWNMAGDLAINPDVRDMGFSLPKDCLMPKAFKMKEGLSIEEYYIALMEQIPPEARTGNDGTEGVCNGRCGGVGGNKNDNEADGDDPDGHTEGANKRLAEQVASDIKDAANKQAGNIPGSLLRWAESMLAPAKIPWQQKLRRSVRNALTIKAGNADYRYGKPSRRQSAMGYGAGQPILPRMINYIPKVTVAIDTSGSMCGEELNMALSELSGIVKSVGYGVQFISCDAIVHEDRPIQKWQDALKLLKGGGGTDFNPIFEKLSHPNKRPDVCIVLTDGYGPAPKAPPQGVDVIWALVGKNTTVPAPWGDVVEIKD